MVVQVPLMVDERILNAYQYLPQEAYILKPELQSEINFIGSLRSPDSVSSESDWASVKSALGKLSRRGSQWHKVWDHMRHYNLRTFVELLDPHRLEITDSMAS